MSGHHWLIIIAAMLAATLLFHFYIYKNYHYVCPNCSAKFKPPFLRSLIAVNAGQHRGMRCADCHMYGYMEALKDSREKKEKKKKRKAKASDNTVSETPAGSGGETGGPAESAEE